ncbi:hypothetical protein [Deminuibacter soli]|uniref:Uncharacterized protein n=1 Tax=Deminuibacter soli TaxID=2291815 RepID=A0A3E1NQ36_9BACT|nr:hypothetical protein [Deminuibacter soli]RFM30041.1 hypothetical protein DXN05_03455 [Deminuibacter soli]
MEFWFYAGVICAALTLILVGYLNFLKENSQFQKLTRHGLLIAAIVGALIALATSVSGHIAANEADAKLKNARDTINLLLHTNLDSSKRLLQKSDTALATSLTIIDSLKKLSLLQSKLLDKENEISVQAKEYAFQSMGDKSAPKIIIRPVIQNLPAYTKTLMETSFQSFMYLKNTGKYPIVSINYRIEDIMGHPYEGLMPLGTIAYLGPGDSVKMYSSTQKVKESSFAGYIASISWRGGNYVYYPIYLINENNYTKSKESFTINGKPRPYRDFLKE